MEIFYRKVKPWVLCLTEQSNLVRYMLSRGSLSLAARGKAMELFRNLQEVISFAIDKEEASYQLYKKTAGMMKEISSRKMLEEMAEQELGHKRLLQGMDKQRIAAYQVVKVPDLKIGDYLVDVEYREDMTYQQILIFAMKAEEKAAQLYMSAQLLTNDPEAIKMLDMLANEEKKHKFLIEALYDDKVLAEN